MVIKKILDKSVDTVAAVSLFCVFIVILAQVVSRYVFQLNIPWSTDVIRIAFIYAIFFGATIGFREKGNLNIDLLFSLLGNRHRMFLSIFINVIIGAFLIFLVVKGMQFVINSGAQYLPYLQLPISALYIAIPLNAFFMLYYLAYHIMEQLTELKKA